MITPLLRLASLAFAARGLREAVAEATHRAIFTLAACLGAAVALFCFSNVALTLLERRFDPAEAWAIIGLFYALGGGLLYLAATRRRRG